MGDHPYWSRRHLDLLGTSLIAGGPGCCQHRGMIRAATDGVRYRFQAAKAWLATDRRWAVAGVGILAFVVLGSGSEVNLAPLVISAVLVTVGVALVRSESPPSHAEAAAPEAVTTPVPRIRRPRSKLGWLTLALVLACLGIALVLDAATDLSLDPAQLAAVALVTIGSGLLLGGWWGRARLLLITLGLMLIPVVLLTSLVEVDLSGRIGGIGQMPMTSEDLPERLDVLAGGGMLDLTQLRLDGEDRVVRIELGIGQIDVLLPHRFRTDVTASLQGGSMWVLGRELDGTDLELSGTADEELAEKGTLTLLIDAGAGTVSVDQAWQPPRGKDRGGKDAARRDGRRGDARRGAENRKSRDRRDRGRDR